MKKNSMQPIDWVTAFIATIIAIYLMWVNDLGAIAATFILIGIWIALEILVSAIHSGSEKKIASIEASAGISHVSPQQKNEISHYENSCCGVFSATAVL